MSDVVAAGVPSPPGAALARETAKGQGSSRERAMRRTARSRGTARTRKGGSRIEAVREVGPSKRGSRRSLSRELSGLKVRRRPGGPYRLRRDALAQKSPRDRARPPRSGVRLERRRRPAGGRRRGRGLRPSVRARRRLRRRAAAGGDGARQARVRRHDRAHLLQLPARRRGCRGPPDPLPLQRIRRRDRTRLRHGAHRDRRDRRRRRQPDAAHRVREPRLPRSSPVGVLVRPAAAWRAGGALGGGLQPGYLQRVRRRRGRPARRSLFPRRTPRAARARLLARRELRGRAAHLDPRVPARTVGPRAVHGRRGVRRGRRGSSPHVSRRRADPARGVGRGRPRGRRHHRGVR